MAREGFNASVEDLIARHLATDAGMELVRVTTGKIGRDSKIEDVVYRTILGAFRIAREEIAVPRVGTMSFDEAMQAVAEGRMVTRPGWGILRALQDGVENPDYVAPFLYRGRSVLDFRLDNLDGNSSGSGNVYSPEEGDLTAKDWMEYQPPEVDIWVDYD